MSCSWTKYVFWLISIYMEIYLDWCWRHCQCWSRSVELVSSGSTFHVSLESCGGRRRFIGCDCRDHQGNGSNIRHHRATASTASGTETRWWRNLKVRQKWVDLKCVSIEYNRNISIPYGKVMFKRHLLKITFWLNNHWLWYEVMELMMLMMMSRMVMMWMRMHPLTLMPGAGR